MTDTSYQAGLASCIRTIAGAPRETRLAVFENMVADAWAFVRKGGIPPNAVVDRFHEAAVAYGLVADHGDDAVQAALVAGIDRPMAAKETTEEGEPPQGIETRERLVAIPWSKVHSLPQREPLVAGLLDKGVMSLVVGASGASKTFFAIDLCARKALGMLWRGRKLEPGGIAYLAVEGGLGIVDRLDAWQKHHKVERVEGVPFYIFPEPIDLCHSDVDVKLLVKRIFELPQNPPIELIVVDTLSRALAGGDENGPRDMGLLVRNSDHLRFETKAHVMGRHDLPCYRAARQKSPCPSAALRRQQAQRRRVDHRRDRGRQGRLRHLRRCGNETDRRQHHRWWRGKLGRLETVARREERLD
jgi:hypothetical protein